MCVLAVQSSLALCGQEVAEKPAGGSHHLLISLLLGFWVGSQRSPLSLYKIALWGTLEARGYDKPCVCITQMLRRGGGQSRGEEHSGTEAVVSDNSHTLSDTTKCCPKGPRVSRLAKRHL